MCAHAWVCVQTWLELETGSPHDLNPELNPETRCITARVRRNIPEISTHLPRPLAERRFFSAHDTGFWEQSPAAHWKDKQCRVNGGCLHYSRCQRWVSLFALLSRLSAEGYEFERRTRVHIAAEEDRQVQLVSQGFEKGLYNKMQRTEFLWCRQARHNKFWTNVTLPAQFLLAPLTTSPR